MLLQQRGPSPTSEDPAVWQEEGWPSDTAARCSSRSPFQAKSLPGKLLGSPGKMCFFKKGTLGAKPTHTLRVLGDPGVHASPGEALWPVSRWRMARPASSGLVGSLVRTGLKGCRADHAVLAPQGCFHPLSRNPRAAWPQPPRPGAGRLLALPTFSEAGMWGDAWAASASHQGLGMKWLCHFQFRKARLT